MRCGKGVGDAVGEENANFPLDKPTVLALFSRFKETRLPMDRIEQNQNPIDVRALLMSCEQLEGLGRNWNSQLCISGKSLLGNHLR